MSHPKWPMIPLGEVVKHRKEFVTIDDNLRYKRCRVQLHAKGVVLRDRVAGSEIKTKTQQVCKASEFLVAEIDAKMGGFGMVPSELDGAVVSSHYFLFTPKPDRLLPEFLDYYSRTPQFREQVTARGTTNYAAIRPSHVVEYVMPLPSVKEQMRLIELVDRFVTKSAEAKELSNQIDIHIDHLPIALARREDLSTSEKGSQGWKEVLLGDVIKADFDDRKVAVDAEYPNFGIYSYGRGLFAKSPISGLETSAPRLRKVRSGQFIYSRLFAWEGAFGLVTDEFDGWFVSSEYPTFTCNQEQVLPEFLLAYFKSPKAWSMVAEGSKGLGSRRQRVQPDQILNHRLLLPPLELQLQIRRVIEVTNSLKSQKEKISLELNAMMPSILDRAFKGEL